MKKVSNVIQRYYTRSLLFSTPKALKHVRKKYINSHMLAFTGTYLHWHRLPVEYRNAESIRYMCIMCVIDSVYNVYALRTKHEIDYYFKHFLTKHELEKLKITLELLK